MGGCAAVQEGVVKLGLSPLQTEHLLPRVICVRCYCVRESACASSIAGIDSEGAAKHVCPGGTLHDAHSLAHRAAAAAAHCGGCKGFRSSRSFGDCGRHRAAASRAFLQWSRVWRQASQHTASSDGRSNSRAFRLFLLILQPSKIVIIRRDCVTTSEGNQSRALPATCVRGGARDISGIAF